MVKVSAALPPSSRPQALAAVGFCRGVVGVPPLSHRLACRSRSCRAAEASRVIVVCCVILRNPRDLRIAVRACREAWDPLSGRWGFLGRFAPLGM